ncbi:efflux transporter outer membrane subunit [Oryzifoliimicrobium ureilyticus]|uniref:efflux transporter outer membrane subunit n=1 Tax=Oryzifoliimicrobium ureilyticus TaxID=3113724 RepID=UPI0030763006
MVSPRFASPALLLLLASCSVGPDHVPPQIQLPAKFGEGTAKPANASVTTTAWWRGFRDKKLDALVSEGITQNLSIQQALERINSAQAQVTVAGAGALPSLDIGGSHTVSGQLGKGNPRTGGADAGATNTSAGSASVSWVLDLFGQYRRAREGARASLDAAYASADAAKLAFIQDLANSYINARYYQERIALSNGDLKSRRETFDLTKFQLDAGAASRLDVVQAEGLVQQTQAEIPGLETSFRQQAHHIATLLGKPASALMDELKRSGPQPIYRGRLEAGVPADLIRNRPDIRQAERNLAAATAQIGVAEAQLYPTLTLSGSISPQYVRPVGPNFNLTPWSFGPSVTLPILDGGRLRANVDIAKSDAKVQYLAWKQTVLSAVEEVENYISAVRRDARTVASLRAQVKTTQESLQLSTASYKDGASSLLDVLDAQRNVSTAQASLAAAIQQMATDYVNLNIAIGGGYNPDGAPTIAPPTITPVAAKSKLN